MDGLLKNTASLNTIKHLPVSLGDKVLMRFDLVKVGACCKKFVCEFLDCGSNWAS